MAAVKSNYLSLRYIQNPTLDILKAAVLQDPQAMRQITNLDLDTVVELLKVSTLILGYVPKQIGLTVDMVRQIITGNDCKSCCRRSLCARTRKAILPLVDANQHGPSIYCH